MAIGVTDGTPRGIAWARRASRARLLGPGTSVTSWMTPDICTPKGRLRFKGTDFLVEHDTRPWTRQPLLIVTVPGPKLMTFIKVPARGETLDVALRQLLDQL